MSDDLRALAERAASHIAGPIPDKPPIKVYAVTPKVDADFAAFQHAANPIAVLGLLDRLDAAEARAAADRALLFEAYKRLAESGYQATARRIAAHLAAAPTGEASS